MTVYFRTIAATLSFERLVLSEDPEGEKESMYARSWEAAYKALSLKRGFLGKNHAGRRL